MTCRRRFKRDWPHKRYHCEFLARAGEPEWLTATQQTFFIEDDLRRAMADHPRTTREDWGVHWMRLHHKDERYELWSGRVYILRNAPFAIGDDGEPIVFTVFFDGGPCHGQTRTFHRPELQGREVYRLDTYDRSSGVRPAFYERTDELAEGGCEVWRYRGEE